MDRAGEAIWAAARSLFPDGATAARNEFGLRVTAPMPTAGRPNRDARPVSIRIAKEVASAMNDADDVALRLMASGAARAIEHRLRAYDPEGEQAAAFIIEIGADEVDD